VRRWAHFVFLEKGANFPEVGYVVAATGGAAGVSNDSAADPISITTRGIMSNPHATIEYPLLHMTETKSVDIIPKRVCIGSNSKSRRVRSKNKIETNIAAEVITGNVICGVKRAF
jgi:hypothetical protein